MDNNKKENKNLITKFLDSINQEIAKADAILFREVSPNRELWPYNNP